MHKGTATHPEKEVLLSPSYDENSVSNRSSEKDDLAP